MKQGTNQWINTLVGAIVTLAGSWYALGLKMEQVVDARVAIAEHRLSAHVDTVAAQRIAPFTASVYAQLDSVKRELAGQVNKVGEGIVHAVRDGDQPIIIQPDTTGSASMQARMDLITKLLADVRAEQIAARMAMDEQKRNNRGNGPDEKHPRR